MLADFEQAYRQFFSFLMRDKAIIAEAVSVELAAPSAPLAAPVLADAPGGGRRGSRSVPGRRVGAKHPFCCIPVAGGRGRGWPGGGTCAPAGGWPARR
jgi:hypothetical protein